MNEIITAPSQDFVAAGAARQGVTTAGAFDGKRRRIAAVDNPIRGFQVRGIGNRPDSNRYNRFGNTALAVADGVGEAVGAAEVGSRNVGIGAVGIHIDLAMFRPAAVGQAKGQFVCVPVGGRYLSSDGEVFIRRHS